MELFSDLLLGLQTSLQPINIFYCFIGALLGTFIGVLPGIGPSATIAMLLPITFSLSPDSALIMLAGIYYGAQYGGSTTAILINLPGESAAAVTAIDGYQMARQGRGGPALAIAALGSFFAGTVATFVIALFAPPLTEMALKFGPAEYFSLIVLGLISSVALAHGSILKALAMVGVGLLLGSIGTDIYTGSMRFTLGLPELADGVNFVSIAVGVFGVSEILRNLEDERTREMVIQKITSLMPSRQDIRDSVGPVLRGTAVGSFLGILPGGGATLSSFASYTIERKISKTPHKFGKGAIQGVAGPEAANNAGAQTSFIPMLSLGIPSNAVMALMVGAMILQGIVPGPNVATQRPELFWGLITSMWVGNLMLVLLNLPLVGLWVRLLRIPYYMLFPAIITFSAIGIYSVNSNALDLYSISIFGILGYLLIKLGCEPAPLLLGFILGPMFEEQLRRAMILSHGDPSVFVTRPISGVLLLLAVVVLGLIVMPAIKKKREEVFVEDE
ncbi:tripartite tricarboxylate transporter permease [Mesorhizobium sp. ZC-5]|uniref:tripartite tricarboxylate transporter permease n=1 Tax=Mesorhizobium sp. ZC-5 TaxID=2986066 RepID=UPI0021E7DD2B|nr:tripartite tricarboxylate transporter permease [Mesorhizobium sp. ZC-5]MCV3242714.1 tripartite tricarboxylate transporter permease [Mesorhizobium sp. ZC-5]